MTADESLIVTPVDPAQVALLMAKYGAQIDAAPTILALLDVTCASVAALLRRTSDAPHREKTLTVIARYFEAVVKPPQPASPDKLNKLKNFSREIVAVVIAERPLLAARARAAEAAARAANPQQAPPQMPAGPARRMVDVAPPEALAACQPERMAEIERLADADQTLDDEAVAEQAESILIDAEDRFSGADNQTTVTKVEPPTLYVGKGFEDLFPEAMCYRVECVTRFLQRHNPLVRRAMPRPFLLSEAFSERLCGVIRDIIVPKMSQVTRNIKMIETSRKWKDVDVREFWEIVDANERFQIPLETAWQAAWDTCRQRRVEKRGAKTKAVMVADPVLLEIRKRLAPVEGEYIIPTIRNPEIDLLCGLAFAFDPALLEREWNRLRQLYEQEMDTRVYQDKAREGALRDSILVAFDKLPDLIGDFITILCYFCFPNVDLRFLEQFTHNKGQTVQVRREKIPYLMHFLDDPGKDAALAGEAEERRVRQEAARAERARRRGIPVSELPP
jgi:hypothetical protein